MSDWDENEPGTLKGFPPPAGYEYKQILFWNGRSPDFYLDGLLPALATPDRQIYLYEKQEAGERSRREDTPNLHYRPLEEPMRQERPAAFVTTSPVPILKRAALNALLLHTPDVPQEQVSSYDLLVFTSKYARHAFLASNTLFDEAKTTVIPMGHFAGESTLPLRRTNTVIYVENPRNGVEEDLFEREIWPAVRKRVPDASLIKVHPDESFLSFTEEAHKIFRSAKCICYLARYEVTATALLITAQAEGVVPLVRKSGALPESIGAGVIYNSDGLEARALMIDKICQLLSDEREWESLSASTAVGIRRHRDWKSIAERWALALKL